MCDDRERATELPKLIEKLKANSSIYQIYCEEELDLVRRISILANKTSEKNDFGKLLGELIETQEKKINTVAELVYSSLKQTTLENENQSGFLVSENEIDYEKLFKGYYSEIIKITEKYLHQAENLSEGKPYDFQSTKPNSLKFD